MRQKYSRYRPAVKAPEPEEGQPADRRRMWYIILLIVSGLLLSASVFLAVTGLLDNEERHFFALINHAYLPTWVAEQVAKPISNAVWGMVFLVVALLVVPKYRLLAWQYVVAAGSAYIAAFIVEHFVDRARPVGLEAYDAVLRASQDGPGFPSSHLTVLTALVITAWPFIAWPWRIVLALFVVAEAWSRMFLGVHAPLDVVGGAAVAAAVVATIHLLPAKIRGVFKLCA